MVDRDQALRLRAACIELDAPSPPTGLWQNHAPMRLFALRGANSVERNERRRHPRRHRRADARADGAQRARPGRDRQLHLHAHRRPQRRVPGGRRAADGLRPRAAAVRAGGPGAGLAAAGDPRARRTTTPTRTTSRATSTSARRGRCAPTSSRHNRSADADRVRRAHPPHPGLSGRRGLRPRAPMWRCSPPTSLRSRRCRGRS